MLKKVQYIRTHEKFLLKTHRCSRQERWQRSVRVTNDRPNLYFFYYRCCCRLLWFGWAAAG